MQPLHAAVLAACDSLDGLIDGQITDPRECHFDPVAIQCPGASYPGKCLTSAQVAAVRAIYEGAHTTSGKALETSQLMRGSEKEWIGLFVPREANGGIGSGAMALNAINHVLFTPNPHYTIANFPFTEAMFAQEEEARKLYNADDPNLAPFAGHGGKLLLWHGWSDSHVGPLGTIDYYERVGRALGADKRNSFVRLFLFPSMGHCDGDEGPSEFPLLASLMAWVEGGQVPNVMIARRHRQNPANLTPEAQAALAAMPPSPPRRRPVYAYPVIARYVGSGSIDDAASFRPFMPKHIDGP